MDSISSPQKVVCILYIIEERKMSEFNTLTERELANVSGGGGGGIAFTIASEIPDFIRGIQKGYSKAKKRNKRHKKH